MLEHARAPEGIASRILLENRIDRGMSDDRSTPEVVGCMVLEGRLPLTDESSPFVGEVAKKVLAAVGSFPFMPESLGSRVKSALDSPPAFHTQAANMTANVQGERGTYFVSSP